ncbi:MAG TPA: hypothetical protein VKE98_22690 [Gemmataceae bacterium]|nr:hypothetical protein [Gemmataceae bacterium]
MPAQMVRDSVCLPLAFANDFRNAKRKQVRWVSAIATIFLFFTISKISQAQEPAIPGRPVQDFEIVNPAPPEATIRFTREPQATENTVEFSRAPVVPATFVDGAPQERPKYGSTKDEDESDFPVTKELPALDRLTRRESEKDLFNRIREETRKKPGSERALFPEETPLTKETYAARQFPPTRSIVEPCYVSHGRLTFEQINFERYGYDCGFFQPAISTAVFAFDLLTMPYQYAKRPGQQFDTSAGKCLPGDPVPMLLYPPEASLTGLLGEAGVVVGLLFGIP